MQNPVGLQAYQQVQVATSDQSKLILRLYERAVTNLARAIAAIERRDYSAKGMLIIKSQDILWELLTALNMEAGLIARNLQALYLFCYKRLNDANLKNDPQAIGEVIRVLSSLKKGWEGLVNRESAIPVGRGRLLETATSVEDNL